MTDTELDLRSRFTVETRAFTEGPLTLELILPARPDELIDDSAFNVDERLPYWAELWPSARALARHLLRQPPPDGPVLELGCGLALPSLVLLSRGFEVLATDYYREALEFARANADRNALPALPTRLLDWRHRPDGLGPYPTLLAADVLYEERNALALAELIPGLVRPGGSLLLADPGRTYRTRFEALMLARGWSCEPEATLVEPADEVAGGPVSHITIYRYRSPADPPNR